MKLLLVRPWRLGQVSNKIKYLQLILNPVKSFLVKLWEDRDPLMQNAAKWLDRL